ncbi:MAG: UDP-N-acetylmuramate--L-alanine ligase [Candidatus Kerfeldbacteria bacterium]|nr:UDP-N-acetylmuramate--L-alanine ligase [Candidatus Kerfeldbacteria bacterium]
MTIPKHIYVLGLGGVGVSAVAKYFLSRGTRVVGSDPRRNPLIDDMVKLGATYYAEEDPVHLDERTELLVYTDDAHEDHPLRQRARSLNIPCQSFAETLGQIMADYPQRLAVAGTNGKSTTSALTGLLLADAGQDPTVFVGSRLTEFNGNLRLGGPGIFVAEADEYRDHFLQLHPNQAVITNIELDHVDYFGNRSRLEKSFLDFAADISPGRLVINGDDRALRTLWPKAVTFGNGSADATISHVKTGAGYQEFSLAWRDLDLGRFTLHIPGSFNIMNAVAAMTASLVAGASPTTFANTLANFRGIWRRFQILTAPTSAVTVVNDYAHHPTAVRVTLEGARAFFPGRRIVAVFQPHHHNRLTALFNDFTRCFAAADRTVIVETYTVSGREPAVADTKSSQELAAALQAQQRHAEYAADPLAAEAFLRHIVEPGDVVLIMGAGDIWHIAESLAATYA